MANKLTDKEKFIEIIKTQIGGGYIWGAQGQKFTTKMLNQFKSWFGKSHYEFNGYSASKWADDGKRDFDCSGLIVWTLQHLNVITSSDDYTAYGLYHRLCFPLTMSELQDGDLVFRTNSSGHIVHVGVYYKGEVIHAKGTKYGVVQTDELETFSMYGRIKEFAHWAYSDYRYLKNNNVPIHNTDFDRNVSFGELVAMCARVLKATKK